MNYRRIDTHLHSQVAKSASGDESRWQCDPRHNVHVALDLSSLPLKNPQPQTNHKKNIRQMPIQGNLTKYLTSTPENCQGHLNHANFEKFSQQRRAYRDHTTKYNGISKMGSWNRKKSDRIKKI